MPETLEKPLVDRLELEHRNPLQAALMGKMLGAEAPVGDQLDWINKYGEKVSDLIDHHEHDEIRDLARDGRYEEAAEKLAELL